MTSGGSGSVSAVKESSESLFEGSRKWLYAAVAAGLVAAGLIAYVLAAPPDDDGTAKASGKPKAKKTKKVVRLTTSKQHDTLF